MSEKLPVDSFKWVENASQFNKDFIENYNEDSDEGCILEIDIQYSKELHDLHNDLDFLSEKMKTEKIDKIVANLHDKKENVIHFSVKVHRVIKFKQKV